MFFRGSADKGAVDSWTTEENYMMQMAMGQRSFAGMGMMAGNRQNGSRVQGGRIRRPESESLTGSGKVEAAPVVDLRTKRMMRVEELRAAIAQGGYRVASADIAEALMDAMMGRK